MITSICLFSFLVFLAFCSPLLYQRVVDPSSVILSPRQAQGKLKSKDHICISPDYKGTIDEYARTDLVLSLARPARGSTSGRLFYGGHFSRDTIPFSDTHRRDADLCSFQLIRPSVRHGHRTQEVAELIQAEFI